MASNWVWVWKKWRTASNLISTESEFNKSIHLGKWTYIASRTEQWWTCWSNGCVVGTFPRPCAVCSSICGFCHCTGALACRAQSGQWWNWWTTNSRPSCRPSSDSSSVCRRNPCSTCPTIWHAIWQVDSSALPGPSGWARPVLWTPRLCTRSPGPIQPCYSIRTKNVFLRPHNRWCPNRIVVVAISHKPFWRLNCY